jgi:hypothetical protein
MFSKITSFFSRISPFFHLVFSVLYGLLVIFCLVGALFGKGYVPVVGLVLTCLAWASARILREASISLKILTFVLKGEETPSDDDHS